MLTFFGGLGPVFSFEWLTATRRWQMYGWRVAFVAALLLGLILAWVSFVRQGDPATIRGQAEIGRLFYQCLVAIELTTLLLVAPAATAGAICHDKARGTLFHVLATDLSDGEIIRGKLAARLLPVVGLVACSLPVVAMGTLLGGIDPVALTGSFLVILGMACLGCTLALTFSVWGKKTSDVLLATYLVWVVWFMVLPSLVFQYGGWGFGGAPPRWLVSTNPVFLTVTAHDPVDPKSPGLVEQAQFLALTLLASGGLVALAVARLRPVLICQSGRAGQSPWNTPRPGFAWWRRVVRRLGPTLDANPVLWREWHRSRPSRGTRIVWAVYIALALGFSAVAIQIALDSGSFVGARVLPATINGCLVSIGLLLLSVASATSLSEERARGSLDVLLATPLPSMTIVWGKWWGAFRTVPLLAVLPGIVSVVLAWKSGHWIGPPLVVGLILAYGAAITSLGLFLAIWIRQPSRVLGLCVAAVVGVTVGLLPVVVLVFDGFEKLAPCVAMVSPLVGVGLSSIVIQGLPRNELWPEIVGAVLFWTIAYVTAADMLLRMTLANFDRCLGRIPDPFDFLRGDPAVERTSRTPAAAVLAEEF